MGKKKLWSCIKKNHFSLKDICEEEFVYKRSCKIWGSWLATVSSQTHSSLMQKCIVHTNASWNPWCPLYCNVAKTNTLIATERLRYTGFVLLSKREHSKSLSRSYSNALHLLWTANRYPKVAMVALCVFYGRTYYTYCSLIPACWEKAEFHAFHLK